MQHDAEGEEQMNNMSRGKLQTKLKLILHFIHYFFQACERAKTSKSCNSDWFRERAVFYDLGGPFSFYERGGGGAGGIWGGALEKIGLKGGASRKKMKEGGGADEKIRLKIG